VAGVVGLAAVAAVVLLVALLGAKGDDRARRPRRSAPAPAAAFQFAADGRRLGVAGLPAWTPRRGTSHSGAVALLGAGAAITLLAPRRPQRAAGFGAAAASADFNRDGFADLAVGSPTAHGNGGPGRPGAVTVFSGSLHGLNADGAKVLLGPSDYLLARGQRYGGVLAAADLDHDGFGDLAVGAPLNDPFPVEDHGSGSIQLLFGGKDGLTTARSRTLRRPLGRDEEFGRLVAVADVDRDGDVDILEAARNHSSYCAGGAKGPTACRPLHGGASALAVADMTGDRRPDVLQGVPRASESGHPAAGALRIRPGTSRGPSRRAIMVTQDGPHIPGNAQAHDDFGTALAAADLDRDGFADVLVGAPGEDQRAGRVTLVRGGPSGYAVSGNRVFEQSQAVVPGKKRAGHRFGAALMLTPGATGVDLTIATPGEGREGTLWMLRGFTPTFAAASTHRVALTSVAGAGGPVAAVALAGASK
jgi:hypothetical protein